MDLLKLAVWFAFIIGAYLYGIRVGRKETRNQWSWHCLHCKTSFHTNRQDVTLMLADSHMEEFHGKPKADA